MKFYIAQHVDGSDYYAWPDEYFFRQKKNAQDFIEKSVERYREGLNVEKAQWEHRKKYSNLDSFKELAAGQQIIIEKYSEQLKELDHSDKKNKGKVNQLKKKIERAEEERDKHLFQIRLKTDYEFWLQNKVDHHRSEWSIIEAEFVDEKEDQ